MNSYHIFEEKESSTILYLAIARDEKQVRELALEAEINLNGLTIEIVNKNVKDQLSRKCDPGIFDSIVH
ncbi:MAG: hypothetical protein M0P47_09295 [Bacteroidales bacterium]|nr:hypothetical protein [Bacteroidales bacterium]